jgi:threonine/homoserine/homoserine lactone efflux protein
MHWQLLYGFVLFSVAMLFTPGPNNIMLMTSGLNYGIRRTLPHVFGVSIGFAFMVAVVGVGIGKLFEIYPLLYTAIKYAGVLYLAWLAFEIARAGPADEGAQARGRPLSFIGAAAFQWVNVKGWVIAIGTFTAYAAVATYPWNIALQSILLMVLGTLSAMTWVLFGTVLRPLLASPRVVRVFNVTMALALIASLYPVLMEA